MSIQKYKINIEDKNQPLLITKAKAKNIRGGEEKQAWLVPELCRITGFSERQRTDIKYKQHKLKNTHFLLRFKLYS